MKNSNEYKLSDNVTVGELQAWMNEKSEESKKHVIKLIRHRFENRYLKHIKPSDSGFLIMAVSCFVIETLQSFREGKPDTNGISKTMFENFFRENQELFPDFPEISVEFYKHIRCGILHQSETTNAWRILKKGKMLDTSEFSINALLFVHALDQSVKNYLDELEDLDFNSKIWERTLDKLTAICRDCERTSG